MKSESFKIYITVAALVLLTAVLLSGSGRMIAFHASQWTGSTAIVEGGSL